jgi:hypothetical protein
LMNISHESTAFLFPSYPWYTPHWSHVWQVTRTWCHEDTY